MLEKNTNPVAYCSHIFPCKHKSLDAGLCFGVDLLKAPIPPLYQPFARIKSHLSFHPSTATEYTQLVLIAATGCRQREAPAHIAVFQDVVVLQLDYRPARVDPWNANMFAKRPSACLTRHFLRRRLFLISQQTLSLITIIF